MLEPTKKRPTEIELRFKGPESKRNDAIKVLRDMGFVDLSNSGASWKEAFPTLQANETGIYLAGARHRLIGSDDDTLDHRLVVQRLERADQACHSKRGRGSWLIFCISWPLLLSSWCLLEWCCRAAQRRAKGRSI